MLIAYSSNMVKGVNKTSCRANAVILEVVSNGAFECNGSALCL